MRFQLRPAQYPDDCERVVEMYNTFETEPATVARVLEWIDKMPEGALFRPTAAVDEEGRVVGYSEVLRMPWSNAGSVWIEVMVDPAMQNQGLGTALLVEAERFALEQGATKLESGVRDNLPAAQAFAKKHGYEVRRHLFESTLAVADFDAARFAGTVEAVTARGIRFQTLADGPWDELSAKIYDFFLLTYPDMPGWEEDGFPPFDEWVKRALGGEAFRADCVILAMDGDRVAGVTRMEPRTATGTMYTYYTGVAREYRGRSIALALKLLAIETARRYGAPLMRTHNDSLNGPMLAINQRLGYLPDPGVYMLKKDYAKP